MNKKSLNRRIAQHYILEGREQGKTDQQLYKELSEEHYGKKAVALLITGTPTKAAKSRYRIYNNILVCLLCFATSVIVLQIFFITIESDQIWLLLLLFLAPLFFLLFAVGIGRYHAPTYRFCALMMILGCFKTFMQSENASITLIAFVYSATVAILCLYLDAMLFPNYKPRKLKTDMAGEYVLEETEETSEKKSAL